MGMKKRFELDIERIDRDYNYKGRDLGCTYSNAVTAFRIWAPTAVHVKLNLYKEGTGNNRVNQYTMEESVEGTFYIEIQGDLNGLYYTYFVTHKDSIHEVVDPYAKAVGANGERGMILDFETTNPKGWENEKKPPFINATDAIIYELHVRDLSTDAESGIKQAGKFLGLVEEGTKNKQGYTTGLDHMKELGITHLHLLPSFDFATIDETKLETNQFNWGYDPKNYNVPEGSYSTDPYHGEVRIKEFKQAIHRLHANGIRVVLDVVYNHTALSEESKFNHIVPGYYYRMVDGEFSNGSACGNEIASERPMVRKYIVDSVVHWATEYHLDGFRFDLMGLHDIETMQEIRKQLDKIDKTILMYGEGWSAGDSPLPTEKSACKDNTYKMKGVASFSDDMRDSVKGSVFHFHGKGFVNGGKGYEEGVKFGIVAATSHKQVKKKVFWALDPVQCINYVSAHDDLTLWDKLSLSALDANEKKRIKMNKLAAAIVITSQGIPFFQAGEELLRSKPGEESGLQFDSNSYKSSDKVNSIKWEEKTKNLNIFLYYKGLIAFRKAHPALRMPTGEEVGKHLSFLEQSLKNVIAYHIIGQPQGESAEEIIIIFNARKQAAVARIPEGTWDVYIDGETAGTEIIRTFTENSVSVPAISAMVLVR